MVSHAAPGRKGCDGPVEWLHDIRSTKKVRPKMNHTYTPLLDRYHQGTNALREAIDGLSPDDLKAHPVPGTWSIQEIVLHLMDSELVLSDRMKRMLAEENPLLVEFDESKFAQRLGYQSLDPLLACEIFEANRRMTAQILTGCKEEDFRRPGKHTERGRVTVADFLEITVDHLAHHLGFLREKRKRLGKPLPAG